MDPSVVEQRLDNVARVRLVESRLLARIIKRHRSVSGAVTHTRCYALSASELARVSHIQELGFDPREDGRPAILIARPPLRELSRLGDRELYDRVLRAAFHARIHLELDERIAAGELDEATIRRRIEAIGRAEFEELRSVFLHDDLLLPPASDREVYVEFCATYLELSEFSPELILTTFPGIGDHDRMRSVIASDLDLAVYSSGAPMPLLRALPKASARKATGGLFVEFRARRLQAAAERAFARRRDGAAAVLGARAAELADEPAREPALRLLSNACFSLSSRLRRAVGLPESAGDAEVQLWAKALERLATHVASLPSTRPSAASRLLGLIEEAARAREASATIVDVPSYLLSLGKRPAVREAALKRDVRLVLVLRQASEQVDVLELLRSEREELATILRQAAGHAADRVRAAIEPRIGSALEAAGLVAHSISERHAREKLVGELCDQVLSRGFFSLPQLRDAISSNDLKLADLSSARELWHGDALLAADRALASELDGIYRRGDVYLRGMQKASSLPFGTRSGRLLTLYAILPLLGAFVVLEGVRLIIGPLLGGLGLGTIERFGFVSYALTAGFLFGLIHSELFRGLARLALDGLGVLLAWMFFRIPRYLITLPAVSRVLGMRWVKNVLRNLVTPALIASFVYLLTPSTLPVVLRIASALVCFTALGLVMGSPVGFWLEDWVVEQLAPTWRMLARRWLPALFRLIARSFAAALELFDRVIHRIDERISVQRSRSPALLFVAGTLGLVWSALAYVIRLYVTLLVEPEINPLKHFPVVTVMHKLTLPLVPDALAALERPLSVFGPIVGGAIAGVTVFLLPSAFGFLTWELKANHKLYRAARPKFIQPARFGPHGETLHELLVPGFHSGRLPKLYDRLRRAAQRHAERRNSLALGKQVSAARTRRLAAAERRDIGRFRAGLREIEAALARFVRLELLVPLASSGDPTLGSLELSRIDLSSNRVRVRLAAGERQAEIRFEQFGGRVLASLPARDALGELGERARVVFENALSVFLQRAQVDLVHEQLVHELGQGAEYEISDERLYVFLDPDHQVELCYRLDVQWPGRLRPRVIRPPRSDESLERRRELSARLLDTRNVLLAHQRIAHADWEGAWALAANGENPPRLLSGPSLLSRQRTASSALPTE